VHKSCGVRDAIFLNVISQLSPGLRCIKQRYFAGRVRRPLRSFYAVSGIQPIARDNFFGRHAPLPWTSFDIQATICGLCSESRAAGVFTVPLAIRFLHPGYSEPVRSGTDAPVPPYSHMPGFIFRCPNTGVRVQAFAAEPATDSESTVDENAREAVHCVMCQQVHYVNPVTGTVLGEEDK